MKIVIAHLYYDLLNLYGESGNVKALKKQLECQGVKVELKNLSIDDNFDFSSYDIVYLGSATKDNQMIALKHLLKYKQDIKKYIEDNKFLIATGNSFELFGNKIDDAKSLNIFNYEAKNENFRLVSECVFKCEYTNEHIIGFQNRGSILKNEKNSLFEVVKGIGNYKESKYEGYNEKNFYGTYLIGPLFIRNPHLLKYMVKKIIASKDGEFKFKKFNLKLETKAYNKYLELKYNDLIMKN